MLSFSYQRRKNEWWFIQSSWFTTIRYLVWGGEAVRPCMWAMESLYRLTYVDQRDITYKPINQPMGFTEYPCVPSTDFLPPQRSDRTYPIFKGNQLIISCRHFYSFRNFLRRIGLPTSVRQATITLLPLKNCYRDTNFFCPLLVSIHLKLDYIAVTLTNVTAGL